MKYAKFHLLSVSLGLVMLVVTGCTRTAEPRIIDLGDSTPAEEVPAATSTPSATTTRPEPAVPTSTTTMTIPARVLHKLPFASQAPLGKWEEIHKEACEEASMALAALHYTNDPTFTPQEMEDTIQKMVRWETERGYKIDVTAAETQTILRDYFNIPSRLERRVTADRLRYEIAQGNVVIIPAAGRELGNPNFQNPGPIYHMLVIIGYDGDEFITHDVGTRNGREYRYDAEHLVSVIHDWDHERAQGGMTDEEMAQGEKVVVIVGKK